VCAWGYLLAEVGLTRYTCIMFGLQKAQYRCSHCGKDLSLQTCKTHIRNFYDADAMKWKTTKSGLPRNVDLASVRWFPWVVVNRGNTKHSNIVSAEAERKRKRQKLLDSNAFDADAMDMSMDVGGDDVLGNNGEGDAIDLTGVGLTESETPSSSSSSSFGPAPPREESVNEQAMRRLVALGHRYGLSTSAIVAFAQEIRTFVPLYWQTQATFFRVAVMSRDMRRDFWR
jgi:hypothetical protein